MWYSEIKAAVLKTIVPQGFEETVKDTDLNDYGSEYCIYGKGEKKIRIYWDVEDGLGGVEFWRNGKWDRSPKIVPESTKEDFVLNMQSLQNSIGSYLNNENV